MSSPVLLAGVARTDITPDRSLDLSGVPCRRSAGVLDRLEAQVLVLCVPASSETAVLAAIDVLYIPRDWGRDVRRRIAADVGIAPDKALDSVMLAASHTHSAPGLQTLRQWGAANPEYCAELADQLVECAKAAAGGLRPADIRVGTSELYGVSENRRTPGGPVDPNVSVIGIVDQQNNPIAIVVNFACHAVTLWGYQNLISPDFPGYLRRELSVVLGPSVMPMFINGAAGNLNPAGFDREHVDVDYSRRTAARIARAALEAWRDSRPIEPTPMFVDCVEHILKLDPLPTDEQLESIIQSERRFADKHAHEPLADDRLLRTMQWADDVRAARRNGDLPTGDILELQAIRLGELMLLAVPGELYVEIGLKLKQLAPFSHMLIVGYANGMLGYLCTRSWQQQAGSQEKFISLRLQSLAADTEDVIYKTASELFERLGSTLTPRGTQPVGLT